jgi:hypothetical protein
MLMVIGEKRRSYSSHGFAAAADAVFSFMMEG